MRKQHRMFLFLAVLIAAAASTAACSNMASTPLQDSNFSLQSSHRDHTATQHVYKAWPNRQFGLAAQKIPEKVVTDYIPGDKLALLFGRRINIQQSAKRFWNTGHIFAGTTLHKPPVKRLQCLVCTSTPTVASILEIPLNRGPSSGI